jgi:hypothetical protein
MLFTEDFLHYVWKFRLFDHMGLQTVDGEPIEIYSAGIHNTDSGPDFQNARIKIADTEWAGNVELHLSSSDWHKHKHSTDNAYDNIILHVVYKDDEPLVLLNGQRISTLELKNRIPVNYTAVIINLFLVTSLLFLVKPVLVNWITLCSVPGLQGY